MPKSTGSVERIQTSVRLSISDSGWVVQRAQELGTFNHVIQQLVEDDRTFYGLPDVLREPLDAEAEALGKNRREYVIHILSLHAAELLRAGSPPRKRGQ